MTTAVIRHRTRPEAAEENQRLIENVFAELESKAPPGLRYGSFRLTDGVTFVHVVDGEGLAELPAFRDFQRDLGTRLAEDLTRDEGTLLGSYASATGTAAAAAVTATGQG